MRALNLFIYREAIVDSIQVSYLSTTLERVNRFRGQDNCFQSIDSGWESEGLVVIFHI
jgi:hypothetical protein